MKKALLTAIIAVTVLSSFAPLNKAKGKVRHTAGNCGYSTHTEAVNASYTVLIQEDATGVWYETTKSQSCNVCTPKWCYSVVWYTSN